MSAVAEIVEKIEKLTLLEASELKKALEDKFGVTAAAPMMMAGAAPGAGAGLHRLGPLPERLEQPRLRVRERFERLLSGAGERRVLGRRGRRGSDRIYRRPQERGRAEDQRYQGCSRGHGSGLEGGEGSR